jgi:CarD family transcriptional regulator
MGNGNKTYYELVPKEETTAKVFVPIDIAEKRIRAAMNMDEAWRLIKEIKAVDEALVENEKEREKFYKEVINSRDPKQLISVLKTLYIRRQKYNSALSIKSEIPQNLCLTRISKN